MDRGRDVFIDGPSLYHSAKALGIKKVDYGALRGSLRTIGDNSRRIQKMWITLPPELAEGSRGKEIRAAGFNVISVSTKDSADDRQLISRIESTDHQRIAEIIVITADKDFLPVLYKIADRNIVVYLVVPRFAVAPDQTPLVGDIIRTEAREGHRKICLLNLADLNLGKKEEKTNPRLPDMEINIRVYESDPRVLERLKEAIEDLKPLLRIETRYKVN